jgi:hypothetical protein
MLRRTRVPGSRTVPRHDGAGLARRTGTCTANPPVDGKGHVVARYCRTTSTANEYIVSISTTSTGRTGDKVIAMKRNVPQLNSAAIVHKSGAALRWGIVQGKGVTVPVSILFIVWWRTTIY